MSSSYQHACIKLLKNIAQGSPTCHLLATVGHSKWVKIPQMSFKTPSHQKIGNCGMGQSDWSYFPMAACYKMTLWHEQLISNCTCCSCRVCASSASTWSPDKVPSSARSFCSPASLLSASSLRVLACRIQTRLHQMHRGVQLVWH